MLHMQHYAILLTLILTKSVLGNITVTYITILYIQQTLHMEHSSKMACLITISGSKGTCIMVLHMECHNNNVTYVTSNPVDLNANKLIIGK
jgi:hypothetical protein